MSVAVGQHLPNISLKTMTPDGVRDVALADFCRGKRVVFFAVPGAFTPACSARHLPGFLERSEALTRAGVDRIACIAVNDAFVMAAWARDNGVNDRIVMLADGNGEFSRAAGLDHDARPFGMGLRSQRYAMVVEDGVVKMLFVDPPGGFEVSSAEHVLQVLERGAG